MLNKDMQVISHLVNVPLSITDRKEHPNENKLLFGEFPLPPSPKSIKNLPKDCR